MNTYTKNIKFTTGEGGEAYLARIIERELSALKDSMDDLDADMVRLDINELEFILNQLQD